MILPYIEQGNLWESSNTSVKQGWPANGPAQQTSSARTDNAFYYDAWASGPPEAIRSPSNVRLTWPRSRAMTIGSWPRKQPLV